MARDIKQLDDITIDVPEEINKTIRSGGNVLVEGTQGTFLSLWHGTYPYVTSKDVTASGICADVGIGPTVVSQVVMVVKAYVTRVGTGPLNNELSEEETIRRGWAEKGTVTGRARRAADFDYETGRRAVMLNGATQIALTKLDIVFPECAKMTSYDMLSAQAKAFVEKIEKRFGCAGYNNRHRCRRYSGYRSEKIASMLFRERIAESAGSSGPIILAADMPYTDKVVQDVTSMIDRMSGCVCALKMNFQLLLPLGIGQIKGHNVCGTCQKHAVYSRHQA